MSTSYGFLQQSGGNISVESKPGKGATFIVHLPALKSAAQTTEKRRVEDKEIKQYSGTILVVEDDTEVRIMATHALVDAGYEVIVANDGHSGLDQFRKYPGIDLVFSDIIMPGGVTGIEMARHILKERSIPLLLATGYTDKMQKERIAGMENVICISKPYDTDELPGLINSMFNKAAS